MGVKELDWVVEPEGKTLEVPAAAKGGFGGDEALPVVSGERGITRVGS